MIRVFQVDDHAIVREGMRLLLMGEPDMELIGEASEGEEAVRKVLQLRPDVILIDLHMPKMGGVETIELIKADWPDARIVVITSFGDDDHIFAAIRAGALGYLLKDSTPNNILDAIRDAAQGRTALSPAVALRMLQELKRPKSDRAPTRDPLTLREVEILKLVAQGLANQAIAEKLFVSERTVRTHVSNILSKLHLANRTQAALYALREGIASLDE